MKPGEKFTQLLKDNNLKVSLAQQKIRRIDDGSLIIENPLLQVDWITQPVEPVAPSEQPAQVPTAAEVIPGKEEHAEPTA